MKRIFALREEEGTRASFKISSLSALKPTLSSAWHLTPFVGILAQLCRRLLLKCSKSGFLFVKLKCNIYEFLTLLRVFPLHFLGNQLQLHFHFSKHNFTFDIYFWIFKDFFQTLCIFWFVFLSSLSLNFIMKKLYIGCSNKFWTGILQKNSYVIKGKKIVKVCLHFSKQCRSLFNLTNFFDNLICK